MSDPVEIKKKTHLCKDHQQAQCRLGSKCTKAHSLKELLKEEGGNAPGVWASVSSTITVCPECKRQSQLAFVKLDRMSKSIVAKCEWNDCHRVRYLGY